MRVALDATPLTLSSGGLRRYTEQLSIALANQFPDDAFTLIGDRAFSMPGTPVRNLLQGPLPRTQVERKWWLLGATLAIRRLHANVFHGTNFEVPYWSVRPSVVTAHDLSPWKNPEWHVGAHRVRKRTPWLLRMGVATMVITPSDTVRLDAIDYFGIAPERVVTVAEGVTKMETTAAPDSPTKPYLLYVGTLEPRKNIPILVSAWRELRKTWDVDLVLAGRRREDGPVLPEEPGLRVAGEVSDAELAGLYRRAFAFVYPSQYEGFGLPVLEAMQAGVPVVISADPALTEVCGGAALRADSPAVLLEALQALCAQPELAAEYREKGLRRAAQFSWAETARKTREVYGEALARFG